MNTYDVAVLLAALVASLCVLIGAKEVAYVVRRDIRRRRVRAELVQMRLRRTCLDPVQRGRAVLSQVSALPARNAWDRDPAIGRDQVSAEDRQRFLRRLSEQQQYVDELRIEGTPKGAA